MDIESAKGRFAWKVLGTLFMPYIFRSGEKYCALNMVHRLLLEKNPKFGKIDAAVLNCVNIQTYYVSLAEARLLNDINFNHCDHFFGSNKSSGRSVIVHLDEVQKLFEYLSFCHSTLILKKDNPKTRCGYFIINSASVIPYTVKNDGTKYVSSSHFDGTFGVLRQHIIELDGWELSYLKLCYKIQGVRRDFIQNNLNQGIDINVLKTFLPQDYTYEEYWPAKHLLQITPSDSEPKSDCWIEPKTPPITNEAAYPFKFGRKIKRPEPIVEKPRTPRTPITLRPILPKPIALKTTPTPSNQLIMIVDNKPAIRLRSGCVRVNTLETAITINQVQIQRAQINNKVLLGIQVPKYGFLVPLNNLITFTGLPVSLCDCLKVITALNMLKYNGNKELVSLLKEHNAIPAPMNVQSLIMVSGKEIEQYIVQIQFMLSSVASRANCETPNTTKRQRIT